MAIEETRAMRRLCLKGILIGGFVDRGPRLAFQELVSISLISAALGGHYLFLLQVPTGFVHIVVTSSPTLLDGCVAGRVANHDHVLNGALCA